jgi:6-phosphofructokinase 1
VIRAVVKKSIQYNWDVIGIRNGWKGLINGEMELLTDYSVSGILPKGGTIIGTSRTNPFKNPQDVQRIEDNIKRFGIDAIVAIGGDDTLGVALKLFKKQIPVIGIPKTIDNDLSGTDYTFGFDTAVSIVTDAIDRLHTTAESHHRVIVLEVMGRHAGWIATISGIAGGADEILIPEVPFNLENVCKNLKRRYERGKKFSIVVVAEGAKPNEGESVVTQTSETDDFGHVRLGGIGHYLAKEIENRMNVETRVTVLGHVQRGGSPTAYDRVLATRFGVEAVELIKNNDFGKMVALQGYKIVPIRLEEAVSKSKTVDMDLYDIATIFFG